MLFIHNDLGTGDWGLGLGLDNKTYSSNSNKRIIFQFYIYTSFKIA